MSWLASILALISTASIVPDMVTGGSIDILLSKPIGRTRLFLTRYFTGLLFVTVQVAVFTIASIVVVGIRGGSWEPWFLLAIPLVVIFFSYLFCICALVGLLTRSTIVALLVTMLFCCSSSGSIRGSDSPNRAASPTRWIWNRSSWISRKR